MLVKKYVRLDWADGKREFDIVIDNVCFFAPFFPKNSKEPDDKSTAVAFTNGTVMQLAVNIDAFRKVIAAYKK